MTRRLLKNRLWIFLGIFLLSGALFSFLYWCKSSYGRKDRDFVLNILDARLLDYKFRLRGPRPFPEEVVFVNVGPKSVDWVGRWPWDRSITAELVEKIWAFRPRVVALDMVFSEESDPDEDAALVEVLRKHPQTILGYYFANDGREVNEEALNLLERSKIGVMLGESEGSLAAALRSVEQKSVEPNAPLFAEAVEEQGSFTVFPDDDGVIRRYPLFLVYRGELYPSIPFLVAKRYFNARTVVPVSRWGTFTGLALVGDGFKRVYEVDDTGSLVLNYYGPGGSVRTVEAVDVLDGQVDPSLFENRVVLVGVGEIGAGDLKPQPFDPTCPGTEILATAVANLIRDEYLREDSGVDGLNLIVLFLSALLASGLVLIRKAYVSFACFLAVLLGVFWLNYGFFLEGYQLSVVFPFLSATFAYAVGEVYRIAVLDREGRFLRRAFASYLDPKVVREIAEDPGKLDLGGVEMEITVLFTDMRNSTGLAEAVSPKKFVTILNRVLGPLTRCVISNNGTLDKYIGDSLMAIFGAPIPNDTHPTDCCRAALCMREAMREVNEGLRKDGLPEVGAGVGFATGRAVVGNMGSDFRFNYSALGDVVNLASRVEGLTKYYGVDILTVGATVERAGEGFLFRKLDRVAVKGKKEPVDLYQLVCYEGEADSTTLNLVKSYERALELFLSGKEEEALKEFERLAEEYDDVPSRRFVERIRGGAAGEGWVFRPEFK